MTTAVMTVVMKGGDMLERPAEMFDREREWAALSVFATGRPLLGVVSGRRRQGKTFLLRSL